MARSQTPQGEQPKVGAANPSKTSPESKGGDSSADAEPLKPENQADAEEPTKKKTTRLGEILRRYETAQIESFEDGKKRLVDVVSKFITTSSMPFAWLQKDESITLASVIVDFSDRQHWVIFRVDRDPWVRFQKGKSTPEDLLKAIEVFEY